MRCIIFMQNLRIMKIIFRLFRGIMPFAIRPLPFAFCYLPFALCLLLFAFCTGPRGFVNKQVPNTPEVGFDVMGSDKKAIDLADSVMSACGGRYAWDQTRFIRWTYFGKREMVWDKLHNKVRIDFIDRDLKIRLNMTDMTGLVRMGGIVQTNPDSIKKYLALGKSFFTNDSYWLLMPFKLKENGVTLKYKGVKKNIYGIDCDAIDITHKSENDAPQGRYNILINPSSHLITQWSFFEKSDSQIPNFTMPWQDYRNLGNILLSVSRGDYRVMTPMGIYKNLPDSTFTSFNAVNYNVAK